MNRSNWFYVKIAVVGIGFIFGLLSPFLGSSEAEYIDIMDCLIVLIFCPVGLLFVIGIQAINPISGKIWTKPSWESNPFNFKDPLHFFHLGALNILATSVGSFISTFFQNPTLWFPVFLYFFAGAGTLAGVQLCQFIYKKKYLAG
jgi:hypothetical protein